MVWRADIRTVWPCCWWVLSRHQGGDDKQGVSKMLLAASCASHESQAASHRAESAVPQAPSSVITWSSHRPLAERPA
jgi:hypothetical protein